MKTFVMLHGINHNMFGKRDPAQYGTVTLADIDARTGALSHPRLVARTLSPSWLALSHDGKFLYAINEISNFGPDKTGSVTAFAVEAGGALKKLDTVSSGGAGPAYISVHPSGKFVMVANYGGFLVPKLALVSNILLMVAILMWRPRGLYAVTNR